MPSFPCRKHLNNGGVGHRQPSPTCVILGVAKNQPPLFDTHFYSFHRDVFLQHYHKRSNVESTFSMLKAKFGTHIRSKSETAQINELLCKVLCHNICMLIQSMYELGVAPTFWKE
jgi:hypothetical protein